GADIVSSVEPLVHRCYCQDTRRRAAHNVARASTLRQWHLQMENAGNDLQAVLDPMVNFLEQQFLELDLGFKLPFGLLKLAALMQFAQPLKLLEEPRTHVATGRLRI